MDILSFFILFIEGYIRISQLSVVKDSSRCEKGLFTFYSQKYKEVCQVHHFVQKLHRLFKTHTTQSYCTTEISAGNSHTKVKGQRGAKV